MGRVLRAFIVGECLSRGGPQVLTDSVAVVLATHTVHERMRPGHAEMTTGWPGTQVFSPCTVYSQLPRSPKHTCFQAPPAGPNHPATALLSMSLACGLGSLSLSLATTTRSSSDFTQPLLTSSGRRITSNNMPICSIQSNASKFRSYFHILQHKVL